MNLIVVTSCDKNSILPRPEVRKEFEYDQNEKCFSDEAQDWIELLLMMNHSFTVRFHTDASAMASNFHNNMMLRVSGYGALIKGEA